MATKLYAEGTKVTSESSLASIKATLRRYGATTFGQVEDEISVGLMFVIHAGSDRERRIRFRMILPDANDAKFLSNRRHQSQQGMSKTQIIANRRAKEENRRWRALALGIKGKLVLVDEQIETVEEAFYAHVVTPSGKTIYEETQPLIAEAYRTGNMPVLLPGLMTAQSPKQIESAEGQIN